MPAAPANQEASLFVAKGFRHDGFAPSPLLSVKCMFNGSALTTPIVPGSRWTKQGISS